MPLEDEKPAAVPHIRRDRESTDTVGTSVPLGTASTGPLVVEGPAILAIIGTKPTTLPVPKLTLGGERDEVPIAPCEVIAKRSSALFTGDVEWQTEAVVVLLFVQIFAFVPVVWRTGEGDTSNEVVRLAVGKPLVPGIHPRGSVGFTDPTPIPIHVGCQKDEPY